MRPDEARPADQAPSIDCLVHNACRQLRRGPARRISRYSQPIERRGIRGMHSGQLPLDAFFNSRARGRCLARPTRDVPSPEVTELESGPANSPTPTLSGLCLAYINHSPAAQSLIDSGRPRGCLRPGERSALPVRPTWDLPILTNPGRHELPSGTGPAKRNGRLSRGAAAQNGSRAPINTAGSALPSSRFCLQVSRRYAEPEPDRAARSARQWSR